MLPHQLVILIPRMSRRCAATVQSAGLDVCVANVGVNIDIIMAGMYRCVVALLIEKDTDLALERKLMLHRQQVL